MNIFYKNKGTISVFLTLILLPVLMIGGLTTDASRIYMSKAVISDAGEMTMNAALAQYNEKLHDEYGLLVMDKTPASMKQDLEKYFNASLNGTGISGTADYDKILDLTAKSFEVLNAAGSEIYRTEVEKQQILEYMKYRAPVCLTELVVEKVKELKHTRLMAEAMEAEMDFGVAMEECQDAFQEAKEALEALNEKINSFHESDVERELSNTEKDYKQEVSRSLLMWAAAQNYRDKLSQSESNIRESVKMFVYLAEKVNLSAPGDQRTYDGYISCMYYKNTIESLGGINKLLQDYDEEQAEEETEDEGEADSAEKDDTEQKELEELVEDYHTQLNRIAGYPDTLLSMAKEKVDSHSNALSMYWNLAKSAEDASNTADGKLKKVEKKIKAAMEKYSVWVGKNSELKAAGKDTEGMEEEVEEYGQFFANNGKSDLKELEKLMSAVQQDKKFFKEWKETLEKEKFFKQSIAKVQSGTQIEKYKSKAKASVSGVEARYSDLERVRGEYSANYEHSPGAYSYTKIQIENYPFYIKLKEYCEEKQDTESQQEKDKANDKLEQSKQAGDEAGKEDDSLSFNWADIGERPSARAESSASQARDSLTDLNGDGGVDRNRKNVVAKFKDAIKEATSFLDALDRIVEKGLENLYIAEYAMQMFSYYTVNMKDGEARAEEDIVSISGYTLKEPNHKAYRAEGEYILWGKDQSKTNVKNTVMMIFGIRLLFNSFFAFTNDAINGVAEAAALAITGAAPYLKPIVKIIIKLGFAGVESLDDISKIKKGYGITIFKNAKTWATFPADSGKTGDNTKGVTFDYSEYLRVFLNVSMVAGNEVGILGRIADCIQVNTPDIDLFQGYTMVSVQAKVSSRTTFMRKISDFGGNGAWGFPDDTYTISYQSILGY